jgi:hypothetical protein
MDGRKNNGNKGHSTKSLGTDKRKNDYKRAIEEAISVEDVALLIRRVKDIALSEDKDRMTALKTLLEYTLGKPHQTITEDVNMTFPKIDMNEWK